MLYSRPVVPQLGWDLEALPETDDGSNYTAKTVDGRAVSFSHRRGWFTVYEGTEEKEIFSTSEINSYRLLPEQMCDILGITVQGKKVAPTQAQIDEECGMVADLSGATTYWVSRHRILSGELESFLQSLVGWIPNTRLLFNDFDNHRFYSLPVTGKHGPSIIVGVEPDEAKLRTLLGLTDVRGTEFRIKLPFALVITLYEPKISTSDNHYQHMQEIIKSGIGKHIEWPKQSFDIFAECKTENPVGMKALEELQALIDKYFCSSSEVVDLQTGAALKSPFKVSYSINVRDWCFEEKDRYCFAGYETAEVRPYLGEQAIGKEGTLYYAIKPAQK